MVIKEFYGTRQDGVKLYKHYSNENLMIQKLGTDEIYSEAIDVEFKNYQYVETDMPIEEEENIEGGDETV